MVWSLICPLYICVCLGVFTPAIGGINCLAGPHALTPPFRSMQSGSERKAFA